MELSISQPSGEVRVSYVAVGGGCGVVKAAATPAAAGVVPTAEWTQLGVVIADDGGGGGGAAAAAAAADGAERREGEAIVLYLNGEPISTASIGPDRVRHSHADAVGPPPASWGSGRPRGKMDRTWVGRRRGGGGRDGDGRGTEGALNGHVGLMSIWAGGNGGGGGGGAGGANDNNNFDGIMKRSYEGGRPLPRDGGADGDEAEAAAAAAAAEEEEAAPPPSYRPPDHLYPLLDNPTTSDSVSRLPDATSHRRHGTVRWFVPVEPYVRPTERTKVSYAKYASGAYEPPTVTDRMRSDSDDVARIRRNHVRNALRHAWEGYRTEAWGYDELKPVSGDVANNWGGVGTTLVDSLSTLWLCGLRDEFWEGRDWVRDVLSYDGVGTVSVFETTIRSLGGLLSAFDLSGDRAFLDKADDLGGRLVKAFDTASGIPYGEVDLDGDGARNTPWHSGNAVLSELGTMQVEFRHLAKVTGKKEYERKAMAVLDKLEKMNPDNGLYSLFIRNDAGAVPAFGSDKISFGAMGDSFYEYLLKVWLQGGKRERKYRQMYDRAMDGMHELLVKKSSPSGLTYVAEMKGGRVEDKMDHLTCYVGGNLVLGAYTNPDGLQSKKAQRDLETGKALAYTCYQMYSRMATGIAPEVVYFDDKTDFAQRNHAKYYILRPETAETFFILHQLTGDPVYREWGWEMFLAIVQHCKTDLAFGSLVDVDDPHRPIDDKMESFFLAETLKYLYLLQDPETDVDILGKHVFNTEAHPLRMLHLV